MLADRLFARTSSPTSCSSPPAPRSPSSLAQVAMPLWPVPITVQTLAVLLVGATLGPVRGALSMVLYAVLGIVGLPVFSDASSGFAVLAGPTGGYIVGFVLAAALTGWLAQRAVGPQASLRGIARLPRRHRRRVRVGLPWLAYALGSLGAPNDLDAVLQAGLYPFIVGGVAEGAARRRHHAARVARARAQRRPPRRAQPPGDGRPVIVAARRNPLSRRSRRFRDRARGIDGLRRRAAADQIRSRARASCRGRRR